MRMVEVNAQGYAHVCTHDFCSSDDDLVLLKTLMKLISLKTTLLSCLLWLLATAASVYAAPMLVTFAVSGFDSTAPESAVSGAILIETDDATQVVTAVTGITLTINGYAFEASEVGFSEYRNFNIVGAQGEGLGSPTGISHGSPHDFWILWNKDTGLPREFAYTGSADEIHTSRQFDVFTINPAP